MKKSSSKKSTSVEASTKTTAKLKVASPTKKKASPTAAAKDNLKAATPYRGRHPSNLIKALKASEHDLQIAKTDLQIAKNILNSKLEGSIPSKFRNSGIKKPQVTYVFQGGGALGSYQVGAYEALSEHGYSPDMLVGISIGAINAAIIAGNKPDQRIDKLCEFWNRITTKIPFSSLPNLGFSKTHHLFSAMSSVVFGQPGFFIPKAVNPWSVPNTTPDQLSIYDTSPLKQTLLDLIDFDLLNAKTTRLCVGAVNLSSGEFIFFDNFEQKITPEHIMASAALPPGFPPIKIGDDYFVDGGIFSNTPISKVIDEFAENEHDIKNVLCFMVDLFSMGNILPHSMDGILERIKDIRFSSHSARNSKLYATAQNLSHAIHFLTSKLTKEQRSDPQVQDVIKLGLAHRLDIVHLIYKSERGTELESKDYEFSLESANKHRKMGYESTCAMIKTDEKNWMQQQRSGVTIYNQKSIRAISHNKVKS